MRLVPTAGALIFIAAVLPLVPVAPALALAPTDGWTVKLIPGTDKILGGLEIEVPPGAIGPGPLVFSPEVAVDGDRVLYTALYDRTSQVYLYESSSGKVTPLTDDQGTSFERPQVSGRWAVWIGGGGRGDIYLRNLVSGATKRFSTQGYVESLRLVGDRLAWQENLPSGGGRLQLYDPARGAPQTIEDATGMHTFGMDRNHLVWVDGADPTQLYLHDLASGETTKLLEAAQPVGSVSISGQVVAWAERTGDRTTTRAYRLDGGDIKTLDTFGPFCPDLKTDDRYVVWTGGESATGARARAYDTESDRAIELSSVDFQGSAASLDQGRVAWARFFSGQGREVILVQDLATGATTQLSNGPFDSGPPVMSGGTAVWTLHNPHYRSPHGHGVLVATAPSGPPEPAFLDLAPNQLYRTAIEWLGEQGYATGYPGVEGSEFRAGRPLLRSQLCKLLAEVLDIPVTDELVHFSDVDSSRPADPYAAQAATSTLAKLGILKGHRRAAPGGLCTALARPGHYSGGARLGLHPSGPAPSDPQTATRACGSPILRTAPT